MRPRGGAPSTLPIVKPLFVLGFKSAPSRPPWPTLPRRRRARPTVSRRLSSERRRQAERREQRGSEGRDLGDEAVLDAEHVELERAELRVAVLAEVARGGRHPVRKGREQAAPAFPQGVPQGRARQVS